MEKKSLKLGKAIRWTDDDLDKLSEITPADIEAAKVFVESASPVLAKIIDARLVDAQNKPAQ